MTGNPVSSDENGCCVVCSLCDVLTGDILKTLPNRYARPLLVRLARRGVLWAEGHPSLRRRGAFGEKRLG